MKTLRRSLTLLAVALLLAARLPAAEPAATDTKDPATGATIRLLSTIPSPAAGVIYFTQECTTPDSRYTLVRYLEPTAGHTAGTMYRYDFQTRELVKLTDRVCKNQVLFPKSANLYYTADKDRAIYVTNLLDRTTRKVADMPSGVACDGGLTVSADETQVVGTGILLAEHPDATPTVGAPNHGPVFGQTFDRHDTNLLLSADIKTGKVTELHRISTWLGHVQFSPTDPALLMYCHEGPWAKVDRIWTLRTGAAKAEPQLVLKRTEDGEIAGHEFWSSDGATTWYDHRYGKDKSQRFLEGRSVANSAIIRYPITPDISSLHYTQSPDGKFFVIDGSTNKEHPEEQAMAILVPENGVFRKVKLCSMEHNDYKAAEPNPHLTPDQRWVTFTATFSGTPQAYAVEAPKEFWR